MWARSGSGDHRQDVPSLCEVSGSAGMQSKGVGIPKRGPKTLEQEHGPLKTVPVVVLPAKPSPRQNFMTRSDAANFLKVARRTPPCAVLRHRMVHWFAEV